MIRFLVKGNFVTLIRPPLVSTAVKLTRETPPLAVPWRAINYSNPLVVICWLSGHIHFQLRPLLFSCSRPSMSGFVMQYKDYDYVFPTQSMAFIDSSTVWLFSNTEQQGESGIHRNSNNNMQIIMFFDSQQCYQYCTWACGYKFGPIGLYRKAWQGKSLFSRETTTYCFLIFFQTALEPVGLLSNNLSTVSQGHSRLRGKQTIQ